MKKHNQHTEQLWKNLNRWSLYKLSSAREAIIMFKMKFLW